MDSRSRSQLHIAFPFCVTFRKTQHLGGCQSRIHFWLQSQRRANHSPADVSKNFNTAIKITFCCLPYTGCAKFYAALWLRYSRIHGCSTVICCLGLHSYVKHTCRHEGWPYHGWHAKWAPRTWGLGGLTGENTKKLPAHKETTTVCHWGKRQTWVTNSASPLLCWE